MSPSEVVAALVVAVALGGATAFVAFFVLAVNTQSVASAVLEVIL